MSGRDFFVSIGDHFLANTSIRCGVPHGSILGPVLLNLYLLPLGNIIREHRIRFHSYDTQLDISLSPNDISPIDKPVECMNHINLWMSSNFLQLNKDKTEVLPQKATNRLQIIKCSSTRMRAHISLKVPSMVACQI